MMTEAGHGKSGGGMSEDDKKTARDVLWRILDLMMPADGKFKMPTEHAFKEDCTPTFDPKGFK
jgi:hypothetical protein